MGEVEAQLVGADVGAGLAHVVAERLAQRRVQQVRRGVVGLRRGARGAVDARVDAGAGRGRLALGHERPGRRRRGARRARVSAAVALGAGDLADVGDLAAAGGVERRLGELEREAPALHGVHADHGGRRLQRLVADELASAARRRRRSSPSPATRRGRRRASGRGAVVHLAPRSPAASTPRPCSAAISWVSSNGKPNVSCSWKASSPPMPSRPWSRARSMSSARIFRPCSSVRPKPVSSASAQRVIASRSRPSSG